MLKDEFHPYILDKKLVSLVVSCRLPCKCSCLTCKSFAAHVTLHMI